MDGDVPGPYSMAGIFPSLRRDRAGLFPVVVLISAFNSIRSKNDSSFGSAGGQNAAALFLIQKER